MANTKKEYAVVLHEIDRADFFGTVPNYKANLLLEKNRIEAENPGYVGDPSVVAEKQKHKNTNKYGKKKGSPHKEL